MGVAHDHQYQGDSPSLSGFTAGRLPKTPSSRQARFQIERALRIIETLKEGVEAYKSSEMLMEVSHALFCAQIAFCPQPYFGTSKAKNNANQGTDYVTPRAGRDAVLIGAKLLRYTLPKQYNRLKLSKVDLAINFDTYLQAVETVGKDSVRSITLFGLKPFPKIFLLLGKAIGELNAWDKHEVTQKSLERAKTYTLEAHRLLYAGKLFGLSKDSYIPPSAT